MASGVTLTVRSVATGLAIGFAAYFVARALWWVEQPANPALMLAAVALYLCTVLPAVLLNESGSDRMPLWVALSVLVASALIVSMVPAAVPDHVMGERFATWYIGAIGILAVTCIVRRRSAVGWLILTVLTIAAMSTLGPGEAFGLGLVGSLLWGTLAQLIMWLLRRAVRDTEELARMEQEVSSWHASQQVRVRERRVRAQTALAIAGPVLTRVVASGGRLSAQEREAARLAEERLRDELRGSVLLNDAVREAIARARARGASVTVLDEGGLDGIPEARRSQIRDEIADVLRDVGALKVIIRAAGRSNVAVTMVGRANAGDNADDDAVELWHEVPRAAPTVNSVEIGEGGS